jgi:hypothetical protein
MLERKRAARGYTAVAGDDEEQVADEGGDEEREDRDIELGIELEGQESGIIRPTVDQELERWDENAEDWETTEPEPIVANSGKKSFDGGGDIGEGKKRND